MELLFVIEYAGLHQHGSDPVFHLNALSNDQIAISQDSSSVANLARSYVTLQKVIAPQQVGYLLGIHAIILFSYRPRSLLALLDEPPSPDPNTAASDRKPSR